MRIDHYTHSTSDLLMAARLWWAAGLILLALLAVLLCRTVHGAPATDADPTGPFQPATRPDILAAGGDA